MQTFKIENYKGIRGTVEVSTDGSGSVVVQGRNAAGKSSFIDGITELFDARGIRLTPHPIHEGEDDAKAEFIDTGLDIRVTREWKRGKDGKPKSTLTVHALDGAKHAKPADVIASLTGGMIFDPSRFLQLDPKPQRDMLLRKVELPFDLDKLEGEERAAEDERLKRGQAARAAEGAVTNADRPAPGTPAEPVSTSELVAELDKAREHNAETRALSMQIEDGNESMIQIGAKISRLRAELAEAEQERNDLAARINTAAEELAGRDLIDTTELESKIQNVDEINRNVQLAGILSKLEAEADQKRGEHTAADDAVKEIQQRKADGLRQAVFPSSHLSVSDDGVLYDGVPFSQANSASRNKAAFAIATAGQSDLRLVIVKDGDLLDEESLAEIDAIAAERGYTVLIERGRPDVGGLVATFVEMVDGQAT